MVVYQLVEGREGQRRPTTPTWNSQAFADSNIQIKDPEDPSGPNLTLCQLFEKGVINEVWCMATQNQTKCGETQETKVVYTNADPPVKASPLKLVSASNGDNITSLGCKVSTRIIDFNTSRGVGCHQHAMGHGWERYMDAQAIPLLAQAGRALPELGSQHARRARRSRNFYSACNSNGSQLTDCIVWDSQIARPFGRQPPRRPSTSRTCPAAAATPTSTRTRPARTRTTPTRPIRSVLSSCEHYGLHDGANGKDMTTPYTNKMTDDLARAQQAGPCTAGSPYCSTDDDCGGHGTSYLYQSFPSYGTAAKNDDGTAHAQLVGLFVLLARARLVPLRPARSGLAEPRSRIVAMIAWLASWSCALCLYLAACSRQRRHPRATDAAAEVPAGGFRVLLFSRTTGFRHDSIPTADRRADRARRGGRLRRRGDRGSGRVHRREPRALPRRRVPDDHRRSAGRRRPGRVRSLDRRGRQLGRRALRGRHRIQLAVLRRAGGRLLQAAPRHPAGDRQRRGRRPSRDRRPALTVDAHRRVVRLSDQPARDRDRADDDRRIDVHGRDDGRRSPAGLGARDRRAAAARSTRRWATPPRATPIRCSASTSSARSAGPPECERRRRCDRARYFNDASFARSSFPAAAFMSSIFTSLPRTSTTKRLPDQTLTSPCFDRVSYFSNALLPPSTVDFS